MLATFQIPAFEMDTSRVVVPTWLRGMSLSQLFHGVGSWFSSIGEVACYALVIAAAVAFVYFYAKALAAAKAGRLVVYRDWTDFIKSAAGPILVLVGLSWLFDGPTTVLRLVGLVGIGYGCYFTYGLFAGAFRCNAGSRAWLALFARIAVMLLMVFALAKLEERFKAYRRGAYGQGVEAVLRGVVIPLALFAWVFHAFIQPMIGPRYARRWI